MLFHLVPLHDWSASRETALDSSISHPRIQVQAWVRVLSALLVVFAIALTPIGAWKSLVCYALGLLWVVQWGRISWGKLLQRLGVELCFALVLLLGVLWRQEGTVLWAWGWLRLTQEGLMGFSTLAVKVLLSLLVLHSLTLTTSVSELLKALALLKFPPLLIAVLAAMQRYLEGLVTEFQTMQRAAKSRNLLGTRARHRQVVGHTIGALFIRSYDRGERIHQAMLARGYRGVRPTQETLKLDRGGAVFLGGTVVLITVARWLGG